MRKLTLMLVALSAIAPAAAQESDHRWVRRAVGVREVCDWTACWKERVFRAVRVPDYGPRVYGWTPPPVNNWRGEGRRCEPTVEVLSTEHTDESNARNAATKLWMAQVQWKFGGVYMDLENAVEVLWRCSASNAHDTISGRLAEGAAKLVGREGQNMRCQLWARPCSGPREPDRGKR